MLLLQQDDLLGSVIVNVIFAALFKFEYAWETSLNFVRLKSLCI